MRAGQVRHATIVGGGHCVGRFFFLFHLRRVHSKPWICEIADIVEGASVFGVVWGFIFC